MSNFVLVKGKDFDHKTAFVLNGNYYDIGVPVVKWADSDGFNAYDTSKSISSVEDRKTGKVKKNVIKGKRYSKRWGGVNAIKQVLCHHTGGYNAKNTFETLHNQRGLSVPFIVEDSSLIYQTLDAVELAWQAGRANKTSIGIEFCNVANAEANPSAYSKKMQTKTNTLPHKIIKQYIQGRIRSVFEMPEAQVDVLVKLVAGLWVARANELGPIYFKTARPGYFMSDDIGEIEVDYRSDAVAHEGLLLHSNVSELKIDMAGVKDMSLVENRITKLFYEYLTGLREI
jgi:hypothetical protein